jgi:hypothetical protein
VPGAFFRSNSDNRAGPVVEEWFGGDNRPMCLAAQANVKCWIDAGETYVESFFGPIILSSAGASLFIFAVIVWSCCVAQGFLQPGTAIASTNEAADR